MLGRNLSQYWHRVYVLPDMPSCTWNGLGTVGCADSSQCRAWVRGPAALSLDSFMHELGHNMGLEHAGAPGAGEYGDGTDVMGPTGVGLR